VQDKISWCSAIQPMFFTVLSFVDESSCSCSRDYNTEQCERPTYIATCELVNMSTVHTVLMYTTTIAIATTLAVSVAMWVIFASDYSR
jgi:hypothetical protein